jgi:hypothetical protein
MILACAMALASDPFLVWDLEQDDGGFQASGDLLQWRWGEPSAGPGGGFDGRRAWAVGLTGNYLNDSTDYLTLPLLDLAGVGRPVLSFEQWYVFGSGDAGWIELDEGLGWHRVEPVYGYPTAAGWAGTSGGWQLASVELPAASAVQARFVFSADLTGVGAGWFLDNLAVWDGDVTPPRVGSLDRLSDSELLDTPFRVGVEVEDDTGVDAVTLHWSTSLGETGELAMVPAGDGTWSGSLPGQGPDTRVSYHVVATDGANETRAPGAGEASFRVYLPAPTDLSGPSGRVVATEVDLSWTAPDSIHPVVGYEIWNAEGQLATSGGTAASVPLSGVDDRFRVRAVYDVGAGDFSAEWEVDGWVPAVLGVAPDAGWPGDRLRVEVIAEHAVFVDGEVAVALGPDVTVTEVEVRDVDRLFLHIEVDDGAAAGPRDLEIDSAAGRFTLADGFTVRDAGERPRLVALDPGSVVQGDDGRMRLRFVGEMATLPSVQAGEGVVVEVESIDGDELVLRYAVAGTAPVGDHAVLVDDGTRIFEGVSLEVRDWRAPVLSGCATAGGAAPAWAGLLAALGAALGRRRDARAGPAYPADGPCASPRINTRSESPASRSPSR